MSDAKDILDAEIVETHAPVRQRGEDGGVYLVVADETAEFDLALKYAARRALSSRAHVGILYVIESQAFTHWSKVEAKMNKELRDKAEKFIWSIAKNLHEKYNHRPVLYIIEGDKNDAIVDVINEDTTIRMMVLGGAASSKPGKLVSYFAGKGLERLRVPVLIVPGHIDQEKIEEISK